MEQKVENKTEQRKEAVKKWLRDPYNIGLVIVLIFAFAIRLYYFSQTAHQPIWWDEGEYVATAKSWGLGVPYDISLSYQRPPLFQLFMAIFYAINIPEHIIKFLVVLLPSLLLVFCIYLLFKDMYSKKIALMSALASSLVWSLLFWGARFQPDFLSLSCQVLSVLYLWKTMKSPSTLNAVLCGLFVALGFYFKISALIIPLAFLVYVILTDGMKFIKNKYYWIIFISFLIALLPFFIWQYVSFGSPIAFAPSYASAESRAGRDLGWMALDYFYSFKMKESSFFKTPFFILFLLGALYFIYNFILKLDIYFKQEKREPSAGLLSLVILITASCYHIFFTKGVIEDRWMLIIIPFAMVFAVEGISLVQKNLSDYAGKLGGIVFVIIIFIIFANAQIQHTSALIDNKKDSYGPVRDAGLWIKDHSNKDDIVLTVSYTQITSYAERRVITFSTMNDTSLDATIAKEHPRYLIVSIFEPHPPFIFSWIEKHKSNVIPVQAYYSDVARQQTALVIYEIK